MPIERDPDNEDYEVHKRWLSKLGKAKKFYTIPDVEGTKHLDVGWHEAEYPIMGATLGVDPYYSDEFMEQNPGITRGIRNPLFKRIGFEEIVGSGMDLPFADGTIDSVSSQHALGYQEGYDPLEDALSEAIRVLRSGGKLGVLIWQAPESMKETRRWLRQQPVKNVRIRIVDKNEGAEFQFIEDESYEAYLYGIEFTRV